MQAAKNRISILQPGYIPWLGFFEQLAKSGVFVFLDDSQFTKNDWRNRNRIKTKDGVLWLTIPVVHSFGQKIIDTRIDNKSPWQRKHLESLKGWYSRSPFFRDYFPEFERVLSRRWDFIVDVDIAVVELINRILGISPEIRRSSELNLATRDKQLRLIEICKKAGGDFFYEGQSGKQYIDDSLFSAEGITVEYQDYHHPSYNQLWMKEQGFISFLSVVDLLFNHGPESLDILMGRKVIPKPEYLCTRRADEVNGN